MQLYVDSGIKKKKNRNQLEQGKDSTTHKDSEEFINT